MVAEHERGLIRVTGELVAHERELFVAHHTVVAAVADLVVGVEADDPQAERVLGEPRRRPREERVAEAVVMIGRRRCR